MKPQKNPSPYATETLPLFKPLPRQEVNLGNVKHALQSLNEINTNAYESFIRYCLNSHCNMSYYTARFIAQTFPLLYSRDGQIPSGVRELIKQAIDNNGNLKNDIVQPKPERPSLK